ncbi:MAG: GTP 3',8-cyclase MoaA [Armatimonadetes bacterium]|nr:GTP 3',8-cyclase MoaA [Armatimonadota bacterium]MDW8122439.1 GTP 3',8-cyclase MoaA [Armatimonadota bacterium]
MKLAKEKATPLLTRERKVLKDRFGRIARKLRISVTDRCNLRCHFCMPADPQWLPKDQLLTYEEISRITKILVGLGVRSVRLTGGEPLVRRNLPHLVALLSSLSGLESLSLTTNGYYLAEQAHALKEKGLQSVTVSLHSLNRERFDQIVGVKGVFDRVNKGLLTALEVGFHPVKVNVVITRGCNDDEIVDFARLARNLSVSVRFIEYMPFDGQKIWDKDRMVSGEEIRKTIEAVFPLTPLPRTPGSTAVNFVFRDGAPGSIGIITSMSQPFCFDCDRIRLTADGKIVPCLFSKDEYDLKTALRSGASDDELEELIRRAFFKKFEGVESLLRKVSTIPHIRPMHTIGG